MKEVDILVIGAGPAGLAAAGYAARAGYSVTALDSQGPGGQLMYIDSIENYPGLEPISGYSLAEKLEDQATSFGVFIDYAEVKEITKQGNTFISHTDGDSYQSKAVIIATGAKHSHLNVPGEEEYAGKGVSYCATCDGPFFKKKVVAVVGGGDTALTDALYLSKLASKVILIHRRDSFRAQKVLQDRVKASENIELCMKHTVKAIEGENEHVTRLILDDDSTLASDGIFIFTGIVPNSEAFKNTVETDGKGFIITNGKMETNVPGILASGDVTNTSFRQVVTAAGDGAIAAHSADEYIQNL